MTDYSPFTPGLPATHDLFVGRDHEVAELTTRVKTATQGQLQVAFLSGERGIGKSSLASLVRWYAERQEQMVGVHVFLGGAPDLREMVRRIFDAILEESLEKKFFDRIKDLFGKNVEKVGLFGLSLQFRASEPELDALVRSFPKAMNELATRLKGGKENGRTGIVLVLDDINGLADQPAFAEWLKSTIDAIAVSNQMIPLCLMLVGLEDRRQALIEHQPSLARAFHLYQITPWTIDETKKFMTETLGRVGVTMSDDALDVVARYAGGLPVLAHELGEALLTGAKGGTQIDQEAAYSAVVRAAKVIGQKHLQPQVLEAVRSKNYRSTLSKVATFVLPGELRFTKSQVVPKLSTDEARNFHNFLQRMVKLGVFLHELDKGAYRFSTYLHHVYFWMTAQDELESTQPDDAPDEPDDGDDGDDPLYENEPVDDEPGPPSS